ncbi:MAG TPA: flagellar hook-length control protein FliK [Pseudoneobacillus sp.]|nr:flagellar hook-length control protein FliK [Pseudoneobacillus sp.]
MGNIGSVAFKPNVNLSMSNKTSDTKTYAGFGAVLTSIMNSNPVTPTENKLATGELLSQEEIKDFISFLENQDILNLENGPELLNQLLSDSNINPKEIAKGLLSISDKDISTILDKLKQILEENKVSKDEENQLFDNMDDLVSLLSAIQSLPIHEFKKIVDQGFAKLMKFTKLVDLLSKNQDSVMKNESNTKLFDSLTAKLEQIMKNSPTSFKTEYLQKTFTLLSGELNQNISTSGKQVEGLEFGNHFLQHMTKPEQLTLMLGEARRPVSTEQLIQQFENILAKSQFSKTEGMQKLLIKLAPEHLGSLRIELIHKDQILVAKILTSTGAAKDSLESHLNGLKQAMANQNIQVERIEISQQMNSQERFLNRDSQHQGRGQDDRKKEPEQQDSQDEFNESFIEALVNLEV